jgi:hypothetical protein
MKIDRLIEEDEPLINCLIVPRKGQNSSSLESDTKKLGVPFKSNGVKRNTLYIEVETGKIINFLKGAFDPLFYDRYSFHLEKDDDDALPEPVESTGRKRQFIASKQRDVQKLTQVRKPLRKPLQVTSAMFDPSQVDASDTQVPVPAQEIVQTSTPSQNTQNDAEVKPDKPPVDTPKQSKPKASGGRKPIGNYETANN